MPRPSIVLDTGTWNQLGSFGPFFKGSSAATGR